MKSQIIIKTAFMTIIIFTMSVAVAGCTASKIDGHNLSVEIPWGFWGGLWHGLIAPLTFIISLFTDNVSMYAKNNVGGWYDFGFCLGAGILFGVSSKASS